MKSSFVSLLFASFCLNSLLASPMQKNSLEYHYTTGRFITVEKPYSEIALFLGKSYEGSWTSFFDFKYFDYQEAAVTFGGGLRYSVNDHSYVGVNLYCDALEEKNLLLKQIGIGAEMGGESWFVYLNGYLPLDSYCHIFRAKYHNFLSGYYYVHKHFLCQYSGCNLEAGYELLKSTENRFALSVSGGPYFYGNPRLPTLLGGQGRAHFRFADFLSVEGIVSYDCHHETRFQASVKIEFPLDIFWRNFSTLSQEHRDPLFRSIKRNDLILKGRKSRWYWNWSYC